MQVFKNPRQNMRRKKPLLAAIFFLALGYGCQNADLEGLFTVPCNRAVKMFYDQECVLIDSANPFGMPQNDAVDRCETWRDEADDVGCNKALEKLLVCMNNISKDKCDDCDAEFADKNACWSGINIDQSGCQSASEFTCYNGTCIPISRRCDGVSDCTLGEDEADCVF